MHMSETADQQIVAITVPTAGDWSPDMIRQEVAALKHEPGALLPILHAIQSRVGYVPEAAVPIIADMLQQTRDAMLEEGVSCDIVSAGGSGSFWITGQHEAVTELQAGGGAFGDPFYTRLCQLEGVSPALTVPAEVVSRPSLTQAVINCGRKAMNPVTCPPELLNQPGATIEWLSAEHTVVSLEGTARDLKIGDRVEFAVGYSDHSILMHREIQIYRSGTKIDTWPVIRRS